MSNSESLMIFPGTEFSQATTIFDLSLVVKRQYLASLYISPLWLDVFFNPDLSIN